MNKKHIIAIVTALMLAVLCASAYVSVPTITDGLGFQYENITIGDDRIQIGDTNITKETTFVVAASDSLHKEGADFICDGLSDNEEINAALALGNTYLMEGNFYNTAPITAPSYRSLEGSGPNTILNVPSSPTTLSWFVTNSDTVGGNSHITISGFAINATGQTCVGDCGLGVLFDKVEYLKIYDLYVSNTWGDGIRCNEISHSIIDDVITHNTGHHSIFLGYSSSYVTISNIVSDITNTEHICVEWDRGIRNHHITINNVVGNDANGAGIYVQNAEDVVISNCAINNTRCASFDIHSDVSRCALTNCIGTITLDSHPIFNIGATTDHITIIGCQGYNPWNGAGKTVYAQGSHVLISNLISSTTRFPLSFTNTASNVLVSNCLFKNFTMGIHIRGTGIKFVDCVWSDPNNPSLILYCYAASTGCEASRNVMDVPITGSKRIVLQAGSSMIMHDNRGHTTENSGSDTIASGSTTKTVTHGLDVTPTAGDIMVTAMGSLGSASFSWIDNYTSTTFDITVNANPGQDVDFAWSGDVY